MATYKTISCKDIVRKVMRDLKPDDANWIYDAVEWIGEALEHVGAGAHVESKGCILDIKDFKGTLPADLYYINQVSVNEDSTSKLSTKIDEIQKQVRELKDRFTFEAGFVESTLNKLADGTISSDITTANLESLDIHRVHRYLIKRNTTIVLLHNQLSKRDTLRGMYKRDNIIQGLLSYRERQNQNVV